MISVAPTVVTRNPDFVVATPSTTSPDLLAQYGAHKAGWNAYVAGEPFDHCQNAQERAGWMSALRAESVASLPVSCADHLGF